MTPLETKTLQEEKTINKLDLIIGGKTTFVFAMVFRYYNIVIGSGHVMASMGEPQAGVLSASGKQPSAPFTVGEAERDILPSPAKIFR